MFNLFNVLIIIGLIPVILYGLFIFIPSLAVTVRHLHDQDRSGWLVLLQFIPFIGGLILFVFTVIEGTKGTKSYGPDPKNPENEIDSIGNE
jgi:uncharacterized membrane protein YhaH (DUF805 family)